MPTKMTVKSVKNQKHDANEFVVFQMFIFGGFPKKTPTCTALIQRKIHVINGFLTKTFIGIDIMKPKNITIDFVNDILIIGIF